MKNVKIMLVMVFALLSMTPMKAQESELIIPDSVSMVKVATRKYCFPLDSLEYYLQMIVGKPVTLFPEELKFSEDVLSKKFITSHTFRRMKNYAQGYYDGIKITVKALEFEGVCNWGFTLLVTMLFVGVNFLLFYMERFSDFLYPLCGFIVACGVLFQSGLPQCGIL